MDDPDRAEKIESCRRLVLRILGGQYDRETHHVELFEEDVIFRMLLYLQLNDPEWLEAQLRDERHPRAGRELLAEVMPRG